MEKRSTFPERWIALLTNTCHFDTSIAHFTRISNWIETAPSFPVPGLPSRNRVRDFYFWISGVTGHGPREYSNRIGDSRG